MSRFPRFPLAVSAAVVLMVSCGPKQEASSVKDSQNLFAQSAKNFRLSLTDAPNPELASVIVNVRHAELRVMKSGKEARVIVGEGLGLVDLLKLQNGVTLPVADLNLPHDVMISQIRFVLESEGNYIIKTNGTTCNLRTPSAQKTGIKFLIHNPVLIEKGFSYSIVADFDAHKSIVLMGNGGCLLKPVLKLKSAGRIPLPTPDEGSGPGAEPGAEPTPTPTPSPTPAPIAGDGDSTQVGDESGWDEGSTSSEPTTYEPPVVPSDDLSIHFGDAHNM